MAAAARKTTTTKAPKTVTVKHPSFDDVFETIPASKLKEFKDQGWKPATDADDVPDETGRTDLGFETDADGRPVEPVTTNA